MRREARGNYIVNETYEWGGNVRKIWNLEFKILEFKTLEIETSEGHDNGKEKKDNHKFRNQNRFSV